MEWKEPDFPWARDATINDKNPQLLELSEQVAALKLQTGAGHAEIVAAEPVGDADAARRKERLCAAGRRCHRPGIAFLLGKDTNGFRDLLTSG